jgi:hypothetical protein
MRARNIVVLISIAIAVSIALGVGSWYAVDPSPGMSALASVWFFWLAGWVHYWVWPESASGLMAMTMAVYTLQYLALFALLAALRPAARLVQDFMRPHKHRSELVRR